MIDRWQRSRYMLRQRSRRPKRYVSAQLCYENKYSLNFSSCAWRESIDLSGFVLEEMAALSVKFAFAKRRFAIKANG